MQREMIVRICSTCNKPLKFHPDGFQEGIYCCEQYYHEGDCIEASFKDEPKHMAQNWLDHYKEMGGDEGDCYFSDWEPEYVEPIA